MSNARCVPRAPLNRRCDTHYGLPLFESGRCEEGRAPTAFDLAWERFARENGYLYGEDALENVEQGWELSELDPDDFEEAWARTGCQFGAMEKGQVKLGWELHRKQGA